MPIGPSTPISFNALYQNLPHIVQTFVKYFIPSSIYKQAFFTGILTSTLFAGAYEMAPVSGGGPESFFFTFGVPGPTAGAGLGFLVATIVAWVGYVLYRRPPLPTAAKSEGA